ncbi:MAG: fructose-1,6-bisphosphatase II [bacterium]|jgi:fructose-1,6-bisphosphatase II
MIRTLGMDIVHVTERAAISAAHFQGMGDSKRILNIARKAACKALSEINISGKFKNDSFANDPNVEPLPETIGAGGEEMDVVLSAVEGHNVCAYGGNDVTSYVSIAKAGGFLELPKLPIYCMIIGQKAQNVIDIHESVTINIKRVARALKKYIENITVCILDGFNKENLIREVQESGARIKMIQEGDISGSLATVINEKFDILIGYSSAQEATLTASAIKCTGGYFLGKICYNQEQDKMLAKESGITDFEKVYRVEDLILTDEIAFAATGITDGVLLDGVKFFPDGGESNSIVTRGESRTLRKIQSRHYFDSKEIQVF